MVDVFSPELARAGVRPYQQRDSGLELRMIEEQQERVDAATARIAHYDEASLAYIAQQIQNWATAYPTMDPIVAYESVTLGIPFDSEVGIEVARESTAFVEEQRRGALPFVGNRILEGSGEALFSDAGRFIGYSELDDEENSIVVRFIANQEQGLDGDVYNAAIENGTFNAGDLIRETRALYAPYTELIGKVSPTHRTYDSFVEDVYMMPATVVADVSAEFGEGTIFNSDTVVRRVRDLHDNNDDWREASIRMTEEQQESIDEIAARMESAREEREGDVSFFKRASQGIMAAAISPYQYFTNEARQHINMMGESLQGALGSAAFGGGGGGGEIVQQPTVMNPVPFTRDAQLGLQFAAGYAGLTQDVLQVAGAAAPYRSALGMSRAQAFGMRGLSAFAPEIIEAAGSPGSGLSPTQQRSLEATDLAIFAEDPSLAGDGWTLGSDLIAERQRREAEFTPTFANGDYFTWGRAVAAGVGFELDSTGYNTLSGTVDAFLAFRGPGEVIPDAAVELGLAGRALPGVRRVPLIGRSDPLINAGGIRIGARPAILRPTTDEWLSSWRGRLVSKRFAEIDNVYDVMAAANNKMDLFTARNIARATTADEVSDILRASMGIGIQQTPRLATRGSLKGVSRPMDWANPLSRFASRMSADVPQTGTLSMRDGNAVYKWADDYMKNASLETAERKAFLNRLADAPVNARFDVIIDLEEFIAAKTLKSILARRAKSISSRLEVAAGKAAEKVSGQSGFVARRQAQIEAEAEQLVGQLTRHFKNSSSEMTIYNIDRVGDTVASPLGRATGPDEVIRSPHLDIEMLRDSIPLPGITDIRTLRTVNKPMYDLMSNLPVYRELDKFVMPLPKVLVEGLTTKLFKPFAILRPAYIMRVVTEEQFRIAAAGGDSFTNNPMAWLSWVLGRGGRNLDLNAKSLNEAPEFAGVQIAARGGDEARVVSTTYGTVQRGEDRFLEGWAGEISQLSSSPVAVHVAANPMRRVQPGAIAPGQPQRFQYSNAELGFVLDEFDETWRAFAEGDPSSAFRQKWDAGDQRGAVQDYLETVERRIGVKTGGSDSLREAVATGKLDVGNGNFVDVQGSGPSSLQANRQFADELENYIGNSPQKVKIQNLQMQGGESETFFRGIVNGLSSAIIAKPSSLLSRSPVFRQNYWAGVAEHGRHLSQDAARQLQKRFAGVEVSGEIRRAVDEAIASANGTMRLKDFDLLMKGQAMDKTNDLLFSMATRQQWQDAARLISPFAAAWQEVITTWMKLLADDPFKLGRIEQADRVLGDPDFAAVMDRFPGFDTIDGQGLIYTDDYDQKRIIVPFAGVYRSIAKAVGAGANPGLPPAQGNAIPLQSVNIGAAFLPGLGPVASFGVSEILDQVRNLTGTDLAQAETPLGRVEELLFPFGESKLEVFNPETWTTLVFPSWVRYGLGALQSQLGEFSALEEDNYNGRVIATMQWLMMNDPQKYDLGNLEKRQLLLSDATSQVREDGAVSLLSAAFGPGPVKREAFILDENGNVQVNVDGTNDSTFMTYLSTASLYRAFLDEATDAGLPYEDAESIAWARTTELSGSTGFIGKGKTRSMLMGSVPVTREAYDWLQDNPDVRTYAGDTWQFFAPYVPDGELYMPMYLESIDQGDRERLTPGEWLEFAQDITAQLLYDNHVRSLGNLGDYAPEYYRDEIREYSDVLKKAYPDWRHTDQQGTPADFAQVQTQLGALTAEGGEFENHEIAPAVREALAFREQAQQQAKDFGWRAGFLDAGGAAWIRALYDSRLTNLVSTYPEANFVIERAFRGEIRNKLFEDLEN